MREERCMSDYYITSFLNKWFYKQKKYQKQKSSKNTQDENCAFLKFTTYPCEIFLMYLIFVFQTLLLLF